MSATRPYEQHTKMLLGMKRWREALLVAAKWVEAQPANGSAWFYKAFAESNAHKANSALASVGRALQLKPDNQLVLSLKAQILGMLGQTEACLEILDTLLDDQQLHPGLLHQVGSTLNNIGRHERAIEVLERALVDMPDKPELLVTLGTACHIVGDSERAAELHKRAIDLQPGDFRAYWLLGQLNKAAPEQNYIAFFADALARHADKLQARICLNYGLAKQYEDLGDYDAAFGHLQRGAAAVLEHTPYDESQDIALVDASLERWTQEFMARDVPGCPSAEPIFIVGLPRTGTTLLEQVIITDDTVDTAGELHHFSRLMNEACLRAADGTDVTAANAYDRLEQIDFAGLGEEYVRGARVHAPDGRHFIDKYPLNFLMVGAILKALPNARIINLRRHPMDSCFSNYKLLFRLGSALHTYDLMTLGRYYCRYDGLMAHWHELAPGRILDVHYENLVADSEAATKDVFDFLGLQWRPECLEFYKSGTAVATASVTQVRKPINRDSLYKWKKFEAHLEPLAALLRGNDIDISC